MSDTPSDLETRVLHIRKEPVDFAPATEWDSALAAISVAVDTCGDVYRGLARLSRSGGCDPSAVLVCLHGVGPCELEFFSIMRRLRPDVGVFVYGDARSQDRIARAIELGATGRAGDGLIEALSAARAAPPTRFTPVPAAEDQTRSRLPASAEPAGEPASRQPRRLSETETDDLPASPQTSPPPARVPWLRYSDGPARTGPSPDKSTDAVVTASGHRKLRTPPDEPLLTSEELNALLEDDIAAIAPEPLDGGPGNEAGVEAGES